MRNYRTIAVCIETLNNIFGERINRQPSLKRKMRFYQDRRPVPYINKANAGKIKNYELRITNYALFKVCAKSELHPIVFMFIRTFRKPPFGELVKIGEENLRTCMSVYLRDKHLLTVGEKLTVYLTAAAYENLVLVLGKSDSLLNTVNDLNTLGRKVRISR